MDTPFDKLIKDLIKEFGKKHVEKINISRLEKPNESLKKLFEDGFIHTFEYTENTILIVVYKDNYLNFCLIDGININIARVDILFKLIKRK